MFKRKKNDVIIEVTLSELRLMVESLLSLRDRLHAEGRYSDVVDEMLIKLLA